jgi:Fur family ferric uptake transcriptional regulator
MSCEAETVRELRQCGSRVTTQRLKIALALQHLGGHRSAEEIFDAVSDSEPHAAIALPTVYRTLNTLRELGLVAKMDAPHAKITYSWVNAREPHHHLICVRCGAELPLDRVVLETLRRTIEEQTDFEPHLGHLSIPGRCSACRDTP